MLTNIGTITVQVTDQDKALEFYTQKLGFEKRSDEPMGPNQRWIEVAPPSAQTRILLYKATPEAPGAPSYQEAKARIGQSTGMVLEVDDIETTFAQLKANGVPIEEEPQKQPWGWWGGLRRPRWQHLWCASLGCSSPCYIQKQAFDGILAQDTPFLRTLSGCVSLCEAGRPHSVVDEQGFVGFDALAASSFGYMREEKWGDGSTAYAVGPCQF